MRRILVTAAALLLSSFSLAPEAMAGPVFVTADPTGCARDLFTGESLASYSSKTSNCTLKADYDTGGFGVIFVGAGVTLNMAGYTISNSSAFFAAPNTGLKNGRFVNASYGPASVASGVTVKQVEFIGNPDFGPTESALGVQGASDVTFEGVTVRNFGGIDVGQANRVTIIASSFEIAGRIRIGDSTQITLRGVRVSTTGGNVLLFNSSAVTLQDVSITFGAEIDATAIGSTAVFTSEVAQLELRDVVLDLSAHSDQYLRCFSVGNVGAAGSVLMKNLSCLTPADNNGPEFFDNTKLVIEDSYWASGGTFYLSKADVTIRNTSLEDRVGAQGFDLFDCSFNLSNSRVVHDPAELGESLVRAYTQNQVVNSQVRLTDNELEGYQYELCVDGACQ